MVDLTEVERFAILSYCRDLSVGAFDGYQSWDIVKSDYIEEAKWYFSKPKSEWPCSVLLLMGLHSKYHRKCDSSDWRE